MGSHPVNLAIRFLLEVAALASMGLWGWNQSDGLMQYIFAIGTPVLAALIWGTFTVPDDPSRSGKAPVAVPGILRLLIELMIFGLSIGMLFIIGHSKFAIALLLIVLAHYIVSYDRLQWLIRH